MGLLHGIFFTGGQAFGSPDTILPVFLNSFTSSQALVGLSSTFMGSLGGIGNVLPQLFVASRLEDKIYKRPILRIAITVRALCWGLLALSTYLLASTHPNLTVFLLFFFLLVFTLMGGIAVVPFFDIWGKALPPHLRGRFFGHRQLWGSALAIGSGFVAKGILGGKSIGFPANFSALFSLAFIFMGISYLALGSVREPVEDVYEHRLTFREFLRKAFSILREDANYRRFLWVGILTGASALALPFYVLYAKDVLKVKLGMVGIFLSAQMFGKVLSNLLWAYLSDFVSNKMVIQISAFLSLLVPLIALITPSHLSTPFILLFVLIGFFIAGRGLGGTNFLLGIAPPKDRPTYVSINGTLTLPVMIFPLIGGLVAQHISYSALFLLTLATLLIGFILSLRLREPAHRGMNDLGGAGPLLEKG